MFTTTLFQDEYRSVEPEADESDHEADESETPVLQSEAGPLNISQEDNNIVKDAMEECEELFAKHSTSTTEKMEK